MRMDLPLASMTHTPSSMMKITIDFVKTPSLSVGTYHRQKTVVMRMDLPLAITYTPSSMMKITIDFVETPSLSIGTYHRQKTVVMRMDLPLASMTHIPK